MKNTAIAFFTASNGEKLEDDINRFFNNHTFTLTNVCYSCCYDISKGKTLHNAMVTYQYIVYNKEAVQNGATNSLLAIEG